MFETTRTTWNNRKKSDFLKVGGLAQKSVFLSHRSEIYFKFKYFGTI